MNKESKATRDAVKAYYAHAAKSNLTHDQARIARRENPTIRNLVLLLIGAAAIVVIAW